VTVFLSLLVPPSRLDEEAEGCQTEQTSAFSRFRPAHGINRKHAIKLSAVADAIIIPVD
jgi:hypothetical protein